LIFFRETNRETYGDKKTFPKEKKVTYKMIQNYVLDNFGLKVHTRYIAEIKRKNGLSMAYVKETENAKIQFLTRLLP